MVTGVSRGLGAALFGEIVASGHRVLALGRRFRPEQEAAAGQQPERIQLRVTDLSDRSSLPGPDELAAFAAGAAPVAMVHNAAVIGPLGAIGTLPAEQVNRAVAVNFVAPMLLTDNLLAALVAASPPDTGPVDRVTVLFVSSGAAHRISGGRVLYSATKRAGEVYFEGLAAQHSDDPQVRSVIVDPGIMDTEMQGQLRGYAHGGGYFPDRERYLRLAEQGLLPSPAEVAKRIAGQYLP